MNLLEQLLPGLRESRIPLAIGALWVATGVLLADRLPSSLMEGRLAASISALQHSVPRPVSGSLAVFGIYLVGVIFNEAGKLVIRVALLGLYVVAVLAVALGAIAVIVRLMPIFVVIAAALTVFLFVDRQRMSGLGGRIGYWLRPLALRLLRWASESWQVIATAWEPAREQVDYLMWEEAHRALTGPEAVRSQVVAQLSVRRLATVASNVLRPGDIRTAGSKLGVVDGCDHVEVDAQFLREDPDVQNVVREAVCNRIFEDEESRRSFVSIAVDLKPLRKHVRNRVERALVRLRADYEGVYGEYDRRRAEGEFRVAVALPLAACLTATANLVISDLGRAGTVTVFSFFYVAPLVAGLVMLVAGKDKKAEASHLLYSSIRQQLVRNDDATEYGVEYFPIRYPEVDADRPSGTGTKAV